MIFNAKNKEIFKFFRRPVDTSAQLILAPSCGRPLDPFRGSSALAQPKPMPHHFHLLIMKNELLNFILIINPEKFPK